MTTYSEARAALQTHWHSEWAARTPVAWENLEFAPPNPPSAWVRLTIQDFNGAQVSLGQPESRLYRSAGLATVQIFSPIDTGGSGHHELVNAAIEAWRGADIAGIRLRDAGVRDVGESDQIWWQSNVRAAYEYDGLRVAA